MASSKANDEVAVSLNKFAQLQLSKAETGNYTDYVGALSAIKSLDDKTPKDSIELCLIRLMQFGAMPVSIVPQLVAALTVDPKKEDRYHTRIIHYLVQLAYGDGYAGTPVPLPSTKRSTQALPKAVDQVPGETLAQAWADLAVDRSTFMRKQYALRALAALAHASLTAKPDDPTYVGGLFMTLQSLLDKIDSIRSNKKGLKNILAQHGGAPNKKTTIAQFKANSEMWGLMRAAFSAARVALSKSGINKIALRSFAGVCSADPAGARHALALASLAARDPQGARGFIEEVGPLLKNNVDLAKKTGFLWWGASHGAKGPGSPPPAISRDQPDNYLNLRDQWARVYLARACAAAIQSAYISGDIQGRGEVFWDALVILAAYDPSELVAMEAVKAMFGAPYPKTQGSIRQAGRSPPGPSLQEQEADMAQAKVYGASWHMVMGVADTEYPSVLAGPAAPQGDVQGQAAGGPKQSMMARPSALQPQGSVPLGQMETGRREEAGNPTLFALLTRRLIRNLQYRASHALQTSAAKATCVLAESRAWCMQLAGYHYNLESEGVRRSLRSLQTLLTMMVSNEGLGAVERSAAAEGLVWLQTPDAPPILTPGAVLRCASQGGYSVPDIVKALFADPWPEPLMASFITAVQQRLRCCPPLADYLLDLASALAAAGPSRTSREQMALLWDAAPGPSAVRAALQLLSGPLPPICQPPHNAPVEVKVLACQEEVAYEGLKSLAAFWIGEHVNQVCGEAAWKPRPKAAISLGRGVAEAGEKLAVAAAAHNPLLAVVIANLQRAMLAGSWCVKVCAAQALAKVAVRSGEPYRLQCYSALLASQGGQGQGADPGGLAPVVRPALEVLDAMYTGELALERHIAEYGTKAQSWPQHALQALSRRHEWLLMQISQRICFVARDVYLPLGPRSRALLRPDEKEEAEEEAAAGEEEGGEPEAGPGAEAAQQAGVEEGAEQSYYQDQQAYYQDEYDQQYDYYAAQQDPLAAWQADGSAQAAAAVNVEWTASYDRQDGAGADDEDARVGTVLYNFSAESEEEVSVSAGERVKVLVDMGDWLHVSTSAGSQGLVPASYISVEDGGGDGALSATSSLAHPGALAGSGAEAEYGNQASSSYYQQYEGSYDAFGEETSYHQGGAGAYGMSGYGYDDGYTSPYANKAALGKKKGGGGFDDFASALVPPPAPPAQVQSPPAPLHSYTSQTSDSSGYPSPRGNSMAGMQQPQGSYTAASATTLQTSPSSSSTSAWTPQQQQVAAAEPEAQSPTVSQPAGGYSGAAWSFPTNEEGTSFVAAQPATASYQATVEEGAGGYSAQHDAEPGSPSATLGTGTVVYDFAAEMENELSVTAGEQVVVKAELDGWYQVQRVSDGHVGLIPASYVNFG